MPVTPASRASPSVLIACVNSSGALLTSRSEEHTSELQSQSNIVCRLLLEKNNAHRTVRCPEVHALREDLLLASPSSDLLIIKSNRWINLRVFIEPLSIDLIWEGCHCAVKH